MRGRCSDIAVETLWSRRASVHYRCAIEAVSAAAVRAISCAPAEQGNGCSRPPACILPAQPPSGAICMGSARSSFSAVRLRSKGRKAGIFLHKAAPVGIVQDGGERCAARCETYADRPLGTRMIPSCDLGSKCEPSSQSTYRVLSAHLRVLTRWCSWSACRTIYLLTV